MKKINEKPLNNTNKQVTIASIIKLDNQEEFTLPASFIDVLRQEEKSVNQLLVLAPSTKILRSYPIRGDDVYKMKIFLGSGTDSTFPEKIKQIMQTNKIESLYSTSGCQEPEEYPEMPLCNALGKVCVWEGYYDLNPMKETRKELLRKIVTQLKQLPMVHDVKVCKMDMKTWR
jgi:hypothetical protein